MEGSNLDIFGYEFGFVYQNHENNKLFVCADWECDDWGFFRIIYFDLDAVFGESSRSGKKAAKDKFIASSIAEYIDSLQKAEEKIE